MATPKKTATPKKAAPAKKAAAKKPAAKKTAASRSGNPAVRAEAEAAQLPTTPLGASNAADFKKRSKGQLLLLPSGLTVRAKRVELQTFVIQGNVPNPLMAVVQEALQKGQEANIPEMMGVEEGKVDMDAVRDMYEMVNAVAMECVQEPRIHPKPQSEADRDDNLVYIDEVDDEDKMFLFQWSGGGTDDIATFREEARADMAALAQKQGFPVPTA